jgi:hypothetical protein
MSEISYQEKLAINNSPKDDPDDPFFVNFTDKDIFIHGFKECYEIISERKIEESSFLVKLKDLGYEMVSSENKYYIFTNNNVISKLYNSRYPMPKGKRHVYLNFSDFEKMGIIFCKISEDSNTRTCFNGTVRTFEFLKIL